MMAGHPLSDKERQEAYDVEFKNIGFFSGKVSELLKFVWAGAIGTYFALLLADATSPAHAYFTANRDAITAAFVATASLIAEYLQFLMAYRGAVSIVDWFNKNPVVTIEELQEETASRWVRANQFLFVIKNFLSLMAGVLLAWPILHTVLG